MRCEENVRMEEIKKTQHISFLRRKRKKKNSRHKLADARAFVRARARSLQHPRAIGLGISLFSLKKITQIHSHRVTLVSVVNENKFLFLKNIPNKYLR
jgi:hypothetical protein